MLTINIIIHPGLSRVYIFYFIPYTATINGVHDGDDIDHPDDPIVATCVFRPAIILYLPLWVPSVI